MQTGIQSFSQFHVNSKSKLYSQLCNKGFYIICFPQSLCIIHGLSSMTFLNEERSLGLKCNKTQCSQHFLAKRVIDPEKTTTANCPQIKTCTFEQQKRKQIFLAVETIRLVFSSQTCCIDVHFNRQWACFIFVICFNKWHLFQQTIVIQKHQLMYDRSM